MDPPFIRGLIPGWTGLVDPMGRCRFSVPADWSVVDADKLAVAPDGAATAVEEWADSPTWARYKASVIGAPNPTVVHRDSPQGLWIEYAAGWAGVHHRVAVPAPGGARVLQIDVRTGRPPRWTTSSGVSPGASSRWSAAVDTLLRRLYIWTSKYDQAGLAPGHA